MRNVRTERSHRIRLVIMMMVGTLFATNFPSQAQFPGRRQGPRFTPDTSHTADALLRNAAAHVRDKQWPEAIDIYQKVISQFADKVAELPKDDPAGDPTGEMPLSIDLRLYCQRKIAALPPEALTIYRARVDSQAERWFKEGERTRDQGLLRRVIDQAYCSSWGDNAIERLGDFAFQDGRFAEALSYYRLLVGTGPKPEQGRLYPDPDVDLAIVAAKAILCRAAMGETSSLETDLKTFATVFPDAQGELAGRKGGLLTILAQAIQEDGLGPASKADARWPTFAGSPTRTRVASGPIDVGSFQWQVKLKSAYTYRPNNYGGGRMNGFNGVMNSNIPRPSEERLLAYHPIIMGDQVIVASDDRVIAYNLNDRPTSTINSATDTVPEAWKHEDANNYPPSATRGISTVPRFTLTGYGDRIYARMGQTGGSSSTRMLPTQSLLVEIDRGTGKALYRRSAAEIQLPRRGGEGSRRAANFEGTPVADERNVYVGLTETEALTQMYVACLDAEKLTTRWVRYLGSGSTVDAGQMMGMGMGGGGGMGGVVSGEVGTRLLTLDGPTIYYQTNMGAVASLDAETGAIRWVATYPRIERNNYGSGPQRDLNPAIIHDGLVIVAPDDATAIFAFDANSGKLVWRSEPIPEDIKLTHVLGVAQGKLIATGDRVLWYDVKTGKLLRAWPDGGRPFEGFGRGLLAGDRVYWPTRGEIHVLDQATGLRSEPPIKLQEAFGTTGGNLVAGDGYLIVAQAESLVVLCQNSRLIQRYRDEIARAPDQPIHYYRLARAAEATGQDDLALRSFAETATHSKASDLIDGVSLLDATHDHQHRLLMKLARKSRDTKAYRDAADRLQQAGEVARSPKDRLTARLELADVFIELNDPQASLDCLQGLLAEEALRGVGVPAGDLQRTVRADLLIANKLGALIQSNGPQIYARYESRAQALLARGQAEGSPRLLEDVARSYPVAKAVPQAWRALAKLNVDRKLPAEAARAYKRLLTSATTDEDRGRALLGMAHAYEDQRHWPLAREAYSQLAARYSDLVIDQLKLGDLARERLAKAPFDRLSGVRDDLMLELPLSRLWAVRWSGSTRVMTADGIPPSPDSGRMFVVQGSSIRPINPATGQAGWTAELGGEPLWIGYVADRVLVATATRILGLNLTQGQVDWDNPLGEASPSTPAGLNPFARANLPVGVGAANEGDVGLGTKVNHLHGFRLHGERLICLKGDSTILAVDGELGQVEWSYSTPSSTFNPLCRIGEHKIVLQTLGERTGVLVLETESGRRLAAFIRSENTPWLRDPVALDDDRVVLVVDRRTVVALDLTRGSDAWSFRESEELPKYGPPRILSDGECLLVLHDGVTLARLDAKTGAKLWRLTLGFKNLSEHPESMVIDGRRLYCATDNQGGEILKAIDLDKGILAWERPLNGPSLGWSVSVTATSILAHPSERSQLDPHEGLPIALVRRRDGWLVQRFQFPAGSPPLEMSLTPHGIMVATDQGLWALGERRAMDAGATSR